jgi:hypothetical protein
MDWEFLKEEILELLDGLGINESSVANVENLADKFVARLSSRYKEEAEHDENGTDSEWDSL